MKFKLDENIGQRGRQLLLVAGHDIATASEQLLTGATDSQLIAATSAEKRCLVTLDLDFANPLLFPPQHYSGIAVLRLPERASQEQLLTLVRTLCKALQTEFIDGRLWIVEIGRIRIYQEESSD